MTGFNNSIRSYPSSALADYPLSVTTDDAQRRARLTVAEHATDIDDAAELLAMLGLLPTRCIAAPPLAEPCAPP